MAYDYTKASNLVSWCLEQKNKPNAYRLGGIGRYENGVRIFDCVGLIKCFMWHDYSEKNASYYNKQVPDLNETGFFNKATEKGPINTIPEIPGLMVYQKGHIGVYLGNGQVIESTIAFDKKIVITYFKGNHPDTDKKRTTWTHWFKMPYLKYDAIKKTNEQIADEVIDGKWGNGADRKKRLTKAGYDYPAIQKIVNQKLSGNKMTSKKNLNEVAEKVFNGDFGNGQTRINKLKSVGYTDAEINLIQQLVNKMCK